MHILFISQYYPPEIGAASNRISYFAQFLAKTGHTVSVLTSAPNYPEGKIYPGFQNRFSVKQENGVTVYRTRIFLTPKANTLARLIHYLSFMVSSFITRRKIEKPDIIIATSPPLFTGLIGIIFKKLWRVPIILDIRDLWPESVESVGAVKNKKLLRQGEKLAHWMYKSANRITATSPGIQKNLPESMQEKIIILPNGAELNLFGEGIRNQDARSAWMRKKWNLGGKFAVLYTGNLGLAQAPEIFVKTAEILKQVQDDIVFLLVGSGVLLPKIEKEAREKNLTNIIFAGNQPRNRMPEFVAAANVCIIPYKKADTFRNTLPSKMFDYMAGGKPIIINLKGEASELIAQAQCGLLAKEEDPHDLARLILQIKNSPPEAKQMGEAGRNFVEKNYRREVIAENLCVLIKSMSM